MFLFERIENINGKEEGEGGMKGTIPRLLIVNMTKHNSSSLRITKRDLPLLSGSWFFFLFVFFSFSPRPWNSDALLRRWQFILTRDNASARVLFPIKCPLKMKNPWKKNVGYQQVFLLVLSFCSYRFATVKWGNERHRFHSMCKFISLQVPFECVFQMYVCTYERTWLQQKEGARGRIKGRRWQCCAKNYLLFA